MNNRGTMGGTSVPAGPPPATGPGPMIPDGAMGMVRSTELSSLGVGGGRKSPELSQYYHQDLYLYFKLMFLRYWSGGEVVSIPSKVHLVVFISEGH